MTQREEFESLVNLTLAVLDVSEARDAEAGGDENASLCLDLYKKYYKDFTREWREMTDLPCPEGCKPCPDGSCVPNNENCA